MTRHTKKLTLLLGPVIAMLAGCAALRPQNLQPLRELSSSELHCLERLAQQLRTQEKNYQDAISDITSVDVEVSRAVFDRTDAEDRTAPRYRELVSEGMPKEDAIRIAGMEQLAKEGKILHHLTVLQQERQTEAKTFLELYAALQKATEAAANNQKEIDEYLNLNWFQRLYVDVKGLDKDGLKGLGEELKVLVDRFAIIRGEK
jgi:hypothetical protein